MSNLKGQYLEALTWQQAEQLFAAEPIIIIPLGARLKEHGLHLPLNNDWVMAEYLTKRLLQECKALAVPTVQFNYFPAFVEYPGSVNVDRETSQQLLDNLVMSLARHGPCKFYVVNTGVSTNWVLEPLRIALQEQDVVLHYFDLLDPANQPPDDLIEQQVGTHADEVETSMMLYIAPDIVDMSKAKDETAAARPGPLTREDDGQTGVYSPSGCWGQPTLASREKGEVVVEHRIKRMVDQVHELAEAGFVPPPPNSRYC